MQDNMERFLETFFEEAAEHLVNMESALLGLEHSPGDQELLNSIFRCAHSIKGASGTFGLCEVARFTHSLENLLDRMRDGTVEASPERLDLLMRSTDVLRGLIESSKSGAQAPPGVEEVLTELNDMLGHDAIPVAASEKPTGPRIPPGVYEYRVVFVPDRDLLRQGMDPLLLLRDLSLAGDVLEVTADLSRLPRLSELEPEDCYLGWSVRLKSSRTPEQIADVFSFVQDSSQVIVEVQAKTAVYEGDLSSRTHMSVRPATDLPEAPLHIPLNKANELIKAAIELVRAQTRVAYAASDFVQCQQAPTRVI